MRKVFLLAAGFGVYVAFMIGYLLFLTLFLPSTVAYEPAWIKVGSYAEYTVEEYLINNLVENGTYAWRVISIYTDANGELVARINETYTLEWKADDWASWRERDISSAGRVLDIKVKDGIGYWFTRYYNDYLIALYDYKIGKINITYEGVGLDIISVGGENRLCIRLTRRPPIQYRVDYYWFDRETGLLLGYSFGFRERAAKEILKSTNIKGEAPSGKAIMDPLKDVKAIMDLLAVSPFLTAPVIQASIGWFFVKRKEKRYGSQYLLLFILSNGAILATFLTLLIRFGRL